MGEYIYLDKNQQKEETSLLAVIRKLHWSMKPAKKMQSNSITLQSISNQINKSESKNIYMNQIMFHIHSFLFTGLHLRCFEQKKIKT